jgi:uncharacterized Zn-finger protein
VCQTATELQRHVVSHSNERPYACTVCDYRAKTKFAINDHMTWHSKDRKIMCEICGASFLHKKSLTSHRKRVHLGGEIHTCYICRKSFTSARSLKEHENFHTGQKSHVCELCGKGFYGSGRLVRHKKMVHGVVERKPWQDTLDLSSSNSNLVEQTDAMCTFGSSTEDNFLSTVSPFYPGAGDMQGISIDIPELHVDVKVEDHTATY